VPVDAKIGIVKSTFTACISVYDQKKVAAVIGLMVILLSVAECVAALPSPAPTPVLTETHCDFASISLIIAPFFNEREKITFC
jgi:hypothetical protein